MSKNHLSRHTQNTLLLEKDLFPDLSLSLSADLSVMLVRE